MCVYKYICVFTWVQSTRSYFPSIVWFHFVRSSYAIEREIVVCVSFILSLSNIQLCLSWFSSKQRHCQINVLTQTEQQRRRNMPEHTHSHTAQYIQNTHNLFNSPVRIFLHITIDLLPIWISKHFVFCVCVCVCTLSLSFYALCLSVTPDSSVCPSSSFINIVIRMILTLPQRFNKPVCW